MKDSLWHMQPNKAKALMLAKRLLPEFICDAVNLEGINYTLPEIQTLLDGITVGGHKVSDQQVALNQHQAWRRLFQLIEEEKFAVTAEIACALYAQAAKDDALEWGKFRWGHDCGNSVHAAFSRQVAGAVCANGARCGADA